MMACSEMLKNMDMIKKLEERTNTNGEMGKERKDYVRKFPPESDVQKLGAARQKPNQRGDLRPGQVAFSKAPPKEYTQTAAA